MAYRPYRGRRPRRGSGLGVALGALAAGALAVGMSWYFHVPGTGWAGSRSAEALAIAEEPIFEPPPSAALFLERGEAAFKAGRWDEAADAFGAAARLEPVIGDPLARWARSLLNQNRLNAAVERGRQAVEVAPRSAYARAVLAVALDWSGQVDDASALARQAVQLDARSVAAQAALVEVLTDQYRLREADDALAVALRLGPPNPEVYRVQGNLHEMRADYPGAVVAYRRAIELAPAHSYLYVSLGHALRVQGLYDEALTAFARAAELTPTDARAEGGRGMVYAAREDLAPAVAHLRRALEIDPGYPTAYAQLAWLHYARREYEQAAPLFERAVELDRDRARLAQYRHALGWIMLSAKRPTDAREQFVRSLELDPELKGARDGLVALQAAR